MQKICKWLRQQYRLLVGLVVLSFYLSGCIAIVHPTVVPSAPPGQSPKVTPIPAKSDCLEGEKDFTDQIQNILQHPQEYIGKAVTLIGNYRGWDLLKEAQETSPVTRSDWVLRDRCGVIYVLARDGMSLALNPGDKSNTVRVVRVKGIVRMAVNGQPYIEPQEMELLR